LRKQSARNFYNAREAQRQQRQVYQMNAEIYNASAAGKPGIVEPRFVGAISIMKDKIDGVDAAEARRRAPAQLSSLSLK